MVHFKGTVVSEGLKIGDAGSDLSKIKTASISIDPASVSAVSISSEKFTLTGLKSTDSVEVNAKTDQAGCCKVHAIPHDDEIEIILVNPTGSAVDLSSFNIDVIAYGQKFIDGRVHFDERNYSGLHSTSGQKIDKGTFTTIVNLNNTVTDLYDLGHGHNMNLFIPTGSPNKGIEIGFGNDISDIDIFLTGEKNNDWNTYYQQPIDSMITLHEDFTVIVEWEFLDPGGTVNFYIDNVLVTGTTWDQLSNWDENFAPEKFMFGNEDGDNNDRILDGEMDVIQVFDRWLTDFEKKLIGEEKQPLRNEALICYEFDEGDSKDSSGNDNHGKLQGNAVIREYGA